MKVRTLERRTLGIKDEEREREREIRIPGENSGGLVVIYLQDGRGVSTSFDECPSGVSATRTATETLPVAKCENLTHLTLSDSSLSLGSSDLRPRLYPRHSYSRVSMSKTRLWLETGSKRKKAPLIRQSRREEATKILFARHTTRLWRSKG